MILSFRKYQKRAIKHLLDHEGAALFMEMGLGKTACVLWFLRHMILKEFEISKALVIAPYNVADTVWEDERDKWDAFHDLKISKVMGSEQERLAALRVKADIYVINVENTAWLVTHYLTSWPFDCLTIDESSMFKAADSKRWLALQMVLPFMDRRIILTGTPVPNGLHDLWAQLFILDFGERLGEGIVKYRNTYLYPAKTGRHGVTKWGVEPQNAAIIYDKIKDICLTLREADHLELPPLEFIEHKVKLPENVMKKYHQFEETLVLDWLEKRGEEITAATAAVLSNKLLQFAGGAVYTNDIDRREYQIIHTKKMDLIGELIESTNGEPVLIAYQHRHEMERMIKKFGGHLFKGRSDNVERWNNKEFPIMYLHPKSGGHGLNLQYGGDTIIWFGPTWNLEYWLQLPKRIHRSGQENKVRVHTAVAVGTMDVRCAAAAKQKEAGQNELLNATKELFRKYRK